MTLLWLPIGMALPTATGWFALRILERNRPVLQPVERCALSFLLGLTFTMYLSFLAHIAGLAPFTLTGLLGVQVAAVLLIGILWMRCRVCWTLEKPPALPPSAPLPRWAKIAIVILAVWTVAKLVAGFAMLTATPPYFDDAFNNWNMRGKLFFLTRELTLEFAIGNDTLATGGVSSYPPTVPLAKTWLATLARGWHEPLSNSVHVLWFLSALALAYAALRRHMPRTWALAGVYILSSLPLYFFHGTAPYADVFLSAHVLAALSMVAGTATAQDTGSRGSYLRIGAFAAALLVFTKNEALLLHLPALLLALWAAAVHLARTGRMTRAEVKKAYIFYAICIACVLVPWILFKWAHGLTFGNAKSLSGLTPGWQAGVAKSIGINTLLEGNWSLFFPLLLASLIAFRRAVFSSPAALYLGFFLLLYLGQLPLYFFTGLSTEILNQTGYARGLVQLMPAAVVGLALLLHSALAEGGGRPETSSTTHAQPV